MAQGKQMFDNPEAKAMFVKHYQSLSDAPKSQAMFSDKVREAFKEKIVSLEDLPTFYLTAMEVDEIYKKMFNMK